MLCAYELSGVVNASTVSLTDDVSGVLGLGFPRLSTIAEATNGTLHSRKHSKFLIFSTAQPYFATLAQKGQLDYPLFGLGLTRNSSGSLTLGMSLAIHPFEVFSIPHAGAVDGSIVTNISLINWNEVVPFSPFLGSASNTSNYLQWTVPLGGISVCLTADQLCIVFIWL